MVALSTIAYTGDMLRYNGTNFEHTGEVLGFFEGHFLEVDKTGKPRGSVK